VSQAPVVELRGVTKSFARRPVLLDVDLQVAPGCGAMIVGANGSGKTTLLAIIAGASRADSGTVRVFGEDATNLSPGARRRIGLMSHQSQLYPNLSARENLEFFATIFNVENPRARASELLDRVGLQKFSDVRIRMLSRGMEQRVAAARAMVASPDLLVLDEPLASLDAAGVECVTSMSVDAMKRGASVVMSAHSPIAITGAQFEIVKLRDAFAAGERMPGASALSAPVTRAAG